MPRLTKKRLAVISRKRAKRLSRNLVDPLARTFEHSRSGGFGTDKCAELDDSQSEHSALSGEEVGESSSKSYRVIDVAPEVCSNLVGSCGSVYFHLRSGADR